MGLVLSKLSGAKGYLNYGRGGFDADALAFFTAANITDNTQKSAVNQLVLDLKGYGIWTKQKALYPVVGGVSAGHAINLRTPGTYNLSFTAGWVHSSTGMTPNGSSDYANTFLNTNSVFSTDNLHLSYYSRTDVNTTQVEIGNATNPSGPFCILEIRTAGTTYFAINQNSTFTTASDANSLGFYIGTRTGTVVNGFKNSTKIATLLSSVATARPNFNVYLGAANIANNATYYSTKQCAFASIGDGLTDTEAANFYTAVQKFQTTLGRQV